MTLESRLQRAQAQHHQDCVTDWQQETPSLCSIPQQAIPSTLVCCTNCCTIAYRNTLKRTKTARSHLHSTTTYTRLGLFVICRSAVQVRSSAPVFQSPTAVPHCNT
jgi:hypothetical protein